MRTILFFFLALFGCTGAKLSTTHRSYTLDDPVELRLKNKSLSSALFGEPPCAVDLERLVEGQWEPAGQFVKGREPIPNSYIKIEGQPSKFLFLRSCLAILHLLRPWDTVVMTGYLSINAPPGEYRLVIKLIDYEDYRTPLRTTPARETKVATAPFSYNPPTPKIDAYGWRHIFCEGLILDPAREGLNDRQLEEQFDGLARQYLSLPSVHTAGLGKCDCQASAGYCLRLFIKPSADRNEAIEEIAAYPLQGTERPRINIIY